MDAKLYAPAEHHSHQQMMQRAELYAVAKNKKSTPVTLGLAVMAGMFIGLAFVFYITVTTGNAEASWGVSRLLGGLAFSLGLVLVVICGAELFTSSVLSSIARANRQISTATMLKGWFKVYLGNLLGALLLLALVMGAGLYLLDNGQWGLNALHIAQHKLHHTPLQAFSLGVLCNILVCLAVWMTFSSTQALTKAFMVILPVALFVSTGFEHCVANMFMVPLGMAIKTFAPAEFWAATGALPGQFSDLNLSNFLLANLLPVTLGNIVGGSVLIGLSYWRIHRTPQPQSARAFKRTNSVPQLTNFKEETNMNPLVITLDQIMDPTPVTLTSDNTIQFAIDQLIHNQLSGAPVVNEVGDLLGYLSIQDILVELWCSDYEPNLPQSVGDLMNQSVQTVDPTQTVMELAEHISVDKDQLYPVSSSGIALSMSTLPLEQRAKQATPNRPHHYPVVQQGKLLGMVGREDILQVLRPLYGEQLNQVPKAEPSMVA
ncbi:formate transporter FocA [Neiella marina]|uniref:Formate transporter FocA n=1 Tax=Neiella holothuriorum TaxID=2870530 RepID=A0ABS7EAZ4_9GAMM|nr:formate transporter FocA [Neiella holothuriorum]MBW8189507.1 formate transporter FocA [Neiella holothuriorum]